MKPHFWLNQHSSVYSIRIKAWFFLKNSLPGGDSMLILHPKTFNIYVFLIFWIVMEEAIKFYYIWTGPFIWTGPRRSRWASISHFKFIFTSRAPEQFFQSLGVCPFLYSIFLYVNSKELSQKAIYSLTLREGPGQWCGWRGQRRPGLGVLKAAKSLDRFRLNLRQVNVVTETN